VEFFLGLEEAGVVAVRRDTQVIRVLGSDVESREEGTYDRIFGSVGLHW
jgi:hypothetical protein